MKKTILAGLMVIAFCITWWVVAGEALQARTRSQQAFKQAWEAYGEAGDREQYNEYQRKRYEQAPQKFEPTFPQAYGEARKEVEQAYKQAQQAIEQATEASSTARAHYDTQFKWGIGAGLLADVLLLVGALAWQKITFKA